ncbi:conserved hypothetical protein [delta proteobacterium NaphS2]|nr:conserved hypothetical protein [delta proteobacterium NaphS2]
MAKTDLKIWHTMKNYIFVVFLDHHNKIVKLVSGGFSLIDPRKMV